MSIAISFFLTTWILGGFLLWGVVLCPYYDDPSITKDMKFHAKLTLLTVLCGPLALIGEIIILFIIGVSALYRKCTRGRTISSALRRWIEGR